MSGMKTVLFVCIHNAGRSQMAEAYFNKMAAGKARAISAGSRPADALNPTVVEAMREVGIDISRNKPKGLTTELLTRIDRAITMGCGDSCPVMGVPTDDWHLEDPAGKSLQEVREIRDQIKTKVAALVKEVIRP